MMRLLPGLGQEQIDGTELWIIADILNSFAPADEEGGAETPEGFARTSEDIIRARLAFAEGKGPAPKPPSPTTPISPAMMEAFEERRRRQKDAASGGNPR